MSLYFDGVLAGTATGVSADFAMPTGAGSWATLPPALRA